MHRLSKPTRIFPYLLCLFSFTHLWANPAGGIEGLFEVNSSGAANYTVPIDIPPGINGAQPNLALRYDSMIPDGPLGPGWSLQGIPSITRGPQTRTVDGRQRAVRFDAADKDRLYFQGQRLVAVQDASGTALTQPDRRAAAYGKDGTVYRTEKESWMKIVGHGDIDGDGAWFEVIQRGGHRWIFGREAQARAEVAGHTRAWGLDQASDLNGNTIAFQYLTNSSGLLLIETIAYTGGHVAATRSVHFAYVDRTPLVQYLGGKTIANDKLLHTITTRVSDRPVTRYTVNYEVSPTSERQRVRAIERCGNAAYEDARATSPNWACFEPTTFSYDDTSSEIHETNLGSPARDMGFSEMFYPADWNGDGLTDFLYKERGNNRFRLLRSTGDRLVDEAFADVSTLGEPARKEQVWSADLNNDGILDMVYLIAAGDHDQYDHRYGAVLSNRNGARNLVVYGQREDTPQDQFGDIRGHWLMDFDGDGDADLIYNRALTSDYLWLPNEGGAFTTARRATTLGDYVHDNGQSKAQWLVDVNGDRLPDLVYIHGLNFNYMVCLNNGEGGFRSARRWHGHAENTAFFFNHWLTDVNGDGLADLMFGQLDNSGGVIQYQALVSTGTSFVKKSLGHAATTYVNIYGAQQWLADMNGDGIPDLLYQQYDGWSDEDNPTEHSTQHYRLQIGRNGSGFDSHETLFGTKDHESDQGDSAQWLLDMDGDGLTDLVYQKKDSNELRVLLNPADKADLITRIEEPFGGRVDIHYKPLTDEALYTEVDTSAPLAEGQQWFHGSMRVVASYRLDAGPTKGQTYNFTYLGGVSDMQRGFMGFRAMTVEGRDTGLRITHRYHTEFPKNGLPRETTEAGDGFSNRTRHGYAATTTANTAVHRVEPTETSEERQLGGTTITTRREYRYDDYGNLIATLDLGDTRHDDDDVLTVNRFRVDPAAWRLNERLESKTLARSTIPSELASLWRRWHAGTDLSWQRWTYDAKGNLTEDQTYVDTHEVWSGTRYAHDRFGNVIQTTNPEGHVTTVRFEDRHHTFPHTTRFAEGGLSQEDRYDARFGLLTSSTDANGHVSSTDFDAHGRPVRNYGPDPDSDDQLLISVTHYGMDGQRGYYVETRTRDTWNEDDQDGWQWKRVYHDGLLRPYRTETQGYRQDQTRVTLTEFDAAGRVMDESLPFYDGEAVRYHRRIYYGDGRIKSITDPMGAVHRFQYGADQQGFYVVATMPDPSAQAGARAGEVSTKTWFDGHGRKVRHRDEEGHISMTAYDRLGRVTTKTDAKGGASGFSYDSRGQITEHDAPDSGISHFGYDLSGRLVESTDALGNKISMTHDAMGRIASKTLSQPSQNLDDVTYRYTYGERGIANGAGRLTSVTSDNLGKATWRYAYDKQGRIKAKTVVPQFGAFAGTTYTSLYRYDPIGRLVETTNPDGSVLRNAYHRWGDYLGRVSLHEPGRRVPEQIIRYEDYTALGQPLLAEYGNGVTTGYGFDALGRMKSSKSTTSGGDRLLDQQFSWNTAHKITAVREGTNRSLSQTFGYSAAGRLTSASGIYGDLDFAYDPNGNLQSRGTVKFQRDVNAVNRLTGSSDGDVYAYHDNGWMSQHHTPDGAAKMWFRYDADGRLISTRVERDQDGTQVISEKTALYDPEGNVFLKRDHEHTTLYAFPGYEITRLSDGSFLRTLHVGGRSGEVAAVTRAGKGDTVASLAMNGALYDRSTLEGLTHAVGYGLLAKMSRVAENGTGGAVLLGLLLSALLLLYLVVAFKGARRASWLGRSREALAAVFDRTGLLESGQARNLASRDVTDYARPRFARAMATGLVLAALTLGGGGTAMAAVTPGANGAGVPVADSIRYFHGDQVFSSRVVTNERGTVTARIAYQPYGRMVTSHGEGTDDFAAKFSGRQWDEDAQLYDFGSRYYDPWSGSFLTTDRAGQFASPYSYVGGDPISRVDPTGDFAVLTAIIIGAIIGAVIGGYFGGVATNNGNFNPAAWDWSSGKTWAGIFVGAAFGAVSGAIGGLGAGASFGAGLALSTISGAVFGGLESLSLAAINGQSGSDLFNAWLTGTLLGGAIGGVAHVGSAALGQIAKRTFKAFRYMRSSLARTIRSGSRAPRALAKLGQCFTENTLVATDEGMVPIDDIEVGEQVWAFNEETGDIEMRPVVRLFRRTKDTLVKVEMDDQVIETTTEHPFYVDGQGWVEAEDLEAGDRLVTRAGQISEVDAISFEKGSFRVYNFEVETAHTYYVAGSLALNQDVAAGPAVLVHNLCNADLRDLRFRYRSIRPNQNMAGAYWKINGRRGQLWSASGPARVGMPDEAPNANIRYSLLKPITREDVSDPIMFEDAVARNTREFDTEFKILEEITQRFRNHQGTATGYVRLHTELAPCNSCDWVMTNFKRRFPNVDLDVTWGPHKEPHFVQ
ncbi:VCBS repeat-containing protein [Sulfidibacter corallicola]|uniref:VCBS repeat-containing protein n=1 Tax=Sulfidibacter corallicola TaxID=2818388 RepID=A0A8A4TJP6_SULCO|nr:polymorphic toxin-type HINT domain-containing protein [Sulfidibacter corallicola]QTD49424.1 VCBS repeat-containing protein [Sulfidibacter corallicola]